MRTLNLHQENIFPLISGLSDGLISIVSFDSCWQKVELFLHFSHPDAVLPVSSHPSLFLLLLMFTLRTKCPVLCHSGHCVLKFTLKMLHKWHISTTNNQGRRKNKMTPTPSHPSNHPPVWWTSKEIWSFLFVIKTQVLTVGVSEKQENLTNARRHIYFTGVKAYWFATQTWQMGKTTSHRLTEDLLVFHNNQCVKPSLFTLFTQSPSQAVTEAKFFTTFVHSRPIAFMNKPLHPFWLHASVGAGLKWGEPVFCWLMRCALKEEWPGVSIHSYLCVLFFNHEYFSIFLSIIVECRWHAWKISSQQLLKHASILKVYE